MNSLPFQTIKGRRAVVVGMAKSGLAVAELLLKRGVNVFVTEVLPGHKVERAVHRLVALGIPYETGGHTLERLSETDFVVLSPGVPETIEIVQHATKMGKPIYSEIEVASWFCRSRIVAVTGSNGKTTTTSLIGEIFRRVEPKTFVGGNIGTPFSEGVMSENQAEYAVLEVSSFQLSNIHSFHPYISVLLNISPDHLDRHKTFEAYVAAKMNISLNQSSQDYLVCNADDPVLMENLKAGKTQIILFSSSPHRGAHVFLDGHEIISKIGDSVRKIIDTREMILRGVHNYMNACAATAAAQCAGINDETIRSVLATFEPIEHRIEYVRELDGVRYFNDSKATNSDAAKQALLSFEEPLILLAGGYAKEHDYSHLAALANDKVRLFVFFGKDRNKLCQDLGADPSQNACLFETLEEAVSCAAANARTGEVVLLSPMCASFDAYAGFEERGRHFKKLVNNLKSKHE